MRKRKSDATHLFPTPNKDRAWRLSRERKRKETKNKRRARNALRNG